MSGLVYLDFSRWLTDFWPLPQGKLVGGIDWDWRNPFAALWGVLDRDDVLWINEFRRAGFCVRKGDNGIRLGIQAVAARIRTDRLKVLSYGCPNLIAESELCCSAITRPFRRKTAPKRSSPPGGKCEAAFRAGLGGLLSD